MPVTWQYSLAVWYAAKQSTLPVQPLPIAVGKETPVPFHSLLQLSAITSHHYLLQGTQFSLREKKKKTNKK